MALRNRFSSTPIASIPTCRSGSSTWGSVNSATAWLAQCHPTPKAAAAAAIESPSWLTISATRRRARSVSTARGERYQAIYSYTDGVGKRRRRSKFFSTKTDARKWLNAGLSEVSQGGVADAGSLTVDQYLRDWLGSLGMQQLEAATISWYRSAAERHIVPQLGHVRLDRLTATQIEAFLAERGISGRLDGSGGLGPASVRRLQISLHKALDAAVRKGLLRVNPADLADKPKMPARDVTADVWTPVQIAAFIEEARTDRLAAIWRTAAMTGLRRSELCGLQWPDVDLDAGRLSVRRARVVVDGRTVTKPPKTARSPADRRSGRRNGGGAQGVAEDADRGVSTRGRGMGAGGVGIERPDWPAVESRVRI